MTNRIVSDADVEAAQDWLFDNAEAIGKAKANKAYFDEIRKVTKSELILGATGTVADKEAKAMSDDRYRAAVRDYAAAVRDEGKYLALQEAMKNKIAVWQSESANMRGKI